MKLNKVNLKNTFLRWILCVAALTNVVLAEDLHLTTSTATVKPLDLNSIMARLTNAIPSTSDQSLPSKARVNATETEIHAQELRKRGYKFIEVKNYSEALKAFQEALVLEPDEKNNLFGLATVQTKLGDISEALKVFEQLVEKYPEDYIIMNNLAWVYATVDEIKFRNGEKALKLAQEALLVAPGDYHVWSTLAEAYYVSGDYEKGARAAKEALNLVVRAGGSDGEKLIYQEQIDKCSRAALALSILE